MSVGERFRYNNVTFSVSFVVAIIPNFVRTKNKAANNQIWLEITSATFYSCFLVRDFTEKVLLTGR